LLTRKNTHLQAPRHLPAGRFYLPDQQTNHQTNQPTNTMLNKLIANQLKKNKKTQPNRVLVRGACF
jgi:hypothetical protein